MLIIDQLRKGDRQLQFIAWGVLLGLGTLLAGLWHVQVISAKRYQANLETQSFRTVRIPSIRGKILDRHEQPIADNRANFTIDLFLEELTRHFQEEFKRIKPDRKLSRDERVHLERQARYRVVSNLVLQVTTSLQQPLSLNERKFHDHYDKRLALPLPVLENLLPEKIAQFVERSGYFPGVDLEIQPIRTYPYNTTAAHLLGFLRRDDRPDDEDEELFNYRLPDFKGAAAIEEAFDQYLRGRPGVNSMLVNNLGYRKSANSQSLPEPGQSVVLTIDLNLQQAAERALRSAPEGVKTRGAAVVLDSRDGDILALASSPTYDPNDFIKGISNEQWQELKDPKLRPMFNRATYGAYAPGSIFKIITALACLEMRFDTNEVITVEPNPKDPAHGVYYVGRRSIRDTAPPGKYDFRRAFKRSSNSYFIHFGLKAGANQLIEFGRQLHLGERLRLSVNPGVAANDARLQNDGERVDLPILPEVDGYFPQRGQKYTSDGETWMDGHTANLCIGQDQIAVTPLQMAVMTAAIANGGKVFVPRLIVGLKPLQSVRGEFSTNYPPAQVWNQLRVKDPQNLDIIRDAMLADVEDTDDSTGHAAYVRGMNICGKTGTAQVQQGGRTVDHITWFVSFAPRQNPRYVVVVMVESGAAGGTTCGPIAQKIYQAIQKQDPTRLVKSETLAEKN